MNFKLALGLGITLLIGILGWGLILRHWKKTLDASELRLRQAIVRKWSAVVVFLILAAAIIYWLELLFGRIPPGPGFALFPLAAIVCLIAAVAVRGLWYFFAPSGKFPWLNTVAYRVTLTMIITGVVVILTLYEFSKTPASVAFSAESNQTAGNLFQVFAFLVIVVGVGEFFLQRILPNPEDETRAADTGSSDSDGESQALNVIVPPGSLIFSFSSNPATKVAYAQYLFYFKQFLEDVDVEVETALSEEPGGMLFSVTPKDKDEALFKIWEALKIYLHLPSQPISEGFNESIAAQRLQATILNLRSQLKLKDAELQAKNYTIRSLDAMNEFQDLRIRRLQSGQILDVPWAGGDTPKPEDPEALIPGIVILGPYDTRGLTINLGEILRRLKKFFATD